MCKLIVKVAHTFITLGLLSELGKINGILVAHCEDDAVCKVLDKTVEVSKLFDPKFKTVVRLMVGTPPSRSDVGLQLSRKEQQQPGNVTRPQLAKIPSKQHTTAVHRYRKGQERMGE